MSKRQLDRHGISFKKSIRAAEQDRSEVVEARATGDLVRNMLEALEAAN